MYENDILFNELNLRNFKVVKMKAKITTKKTGFSDKKFRHKIQR